MFFFPPSPCVYVYMCICSGSLETGGSWLAGCRCAMFGQVPARLAERRWCYRVVAKCGSWADRQRERESGEDCLLTGVLLTCYLALHSHTQPHCSSTQFLFTALLECNQLKVSQVLTLFITSAIEMAAEKKRINPAGRVLYEVRDYFKANWKVLRFSYSAVKRFAKHWSKTWNSAKLTRKYFLL